MNASTPASAYVATAPNPALGDVLKINAAFVAARRNDATNLAPVEFHLTPDNKLAVVETTANTFNKAQVTTTFWPLGNGLRIITQAGVKVKYGRHI